MDQFEVLLALLGLVVCLLLLVVASITWGIHVANQNHQQELGWVQTDIEDLRVQQDQLKTEMSFIQGPLRYPRVRAI